VARRLALKEIQNEADVNAINAVDLIDGDEITVDWLGCEYATLSDGREARYDMIKLSIVQQTSNDALIRSYSGWTNSDLLEICLRNAKHSSLKRRTDEDECKCDDCKNQPECPRN
jgi:hypothetical protein